MDSSLKSACIPLSARIMMCVLSSALAIAQNPRGQVEFLTFTPQGFNPSTINRHAGPIILDIRNATRLPSLQFVLVDQNNKTVVSPGRLGPSEKRRRVQIDLVLTPGTYTLRIQELPAHTAQIVVR
jgi:hypothetical protein